MGPIRTICINFREGMKEELFYYRTGEIANRFPDAKSWFFFFYGVTEGDKRTVLL